LTAADAIHGHYRQERTTASAVGRPGDRSHDQNDRPRPSRSAPAPTFSMAVIDPTDVVSFIDLLT